VDDSPGGRELTGATTGVIPDGLDATVVLVRHGETEFIVEQRFQGRSETPLSPTGFRQADLVARRLAAAQAAPALPVPDHAPLELVHSPLRRTAQTAEAVERAFQAGGRDVERRAEAAFLEIAQGEWEGLHRTEVETRYRAELSAWRRRPLDNWAPGGESLPEVQARVRPGLAAILARLADGRQPGSPDAPQVAGYADAEVDRPWSIIVGHDGVFKVALLTLFDLPLDRFWMWSLDLCAITVVELRAGRPVLRAHNLTAHLAGLASDDAQAQVEARNRSGAL
jgi:broad specificity phosphatase PhoE